MADLMRKKREELARKLAGQYDDVEDFEAAGGDVGDLPGEMLVPDDEFDNPGGPFDEITAGRMRVAKSLVGGETPEEAMKTATAAMNDDRPKKVDVAAMQLSDVLEGLGVSSPLRGGGDELDRQVDAINRLRELEKKGLLSLSEDLNAKADEVLKSIDEIKRFKQKNEALQRMNDLSYRSKSDILNDLALEDVRDLSSMMKDIYEETPFAKRAKEFQKQNPGKPYREEGRE